MYVFSRRRKEKENIFKKSGLLRNIRNKGNNKITELRTILHKESQNS
jgi:hypothetical protein